MDAVERGSDLAFPFLTQRGDGCKTRPAPARLLHRGQSSELFVTALNRVFCPALVASQGLPLQAEVFTRFIGFIAMKCGTHLSPTSVNFSEVPS